MVNLFTSLAIAMRRITSALTGCILTCTTWEFYWYSEWGCCEPPDVEMDNSDLEEPPAKKKIMLCFASPVSPSKMNAICQCSVPLNTN